MPGLGYCRPVMWPQRVRVRPYDVVNPVTCRIHHIIRRCRRGRPGCRQRIGIMSTYLPAGPNLAVSGASFLAEIGLVRV